MPAFVKYDNFPLQLGRKCYDFSSDVCKIALTNVTPNAATHTAFLVGSLHLPPTAANGYTTGGYVVTLDSWSLVSTIATYSVTTDIVVTATTGGIGPFRYAIMYDSTTTSPVNLPLIGYWDYGSSITINAGESVTLDITNSLFTIY